MINILLVFLLFAFPRGAGAAAVDLPKTGQTLCYDAASDSIPCAGTGQDGEFQAGAAWPSPRFTDKGNGTVVDNLSGLVWLKDANCMGLAPTGINLAGALSVANSLHAGQCTLNDGSAPGTWRLPNVNELESLIDLSRMGPALPSPHPFANVQQDFYWSSTTEAVYPTNGIGVNLGTGAQRGIVRTAPEYVWPVKGTSNELPRTGQVSCWSLDGSSFVGCAGSGADGDKQAGVAWPTPRFADNGDGTLTDLLTGLTWLKKADCFPTTSSQALALFKAHSLADGICNLGDGSAQGTWRLPNRKQLRSLINYQGSNGATWLNSQGFSNAQDGWYWTSDASPDTGTGDCWLIKTEGGEWPTSWWALEQANNPPQPQYLLPVRGPLPVAGITLSNLNQTYDGTPKSATATTVPAGLQVVYGYTLNGVSTVPTAAGSYSVVATIKDANYQGSASGTLVVAKASAAVTLTNLSQVYDGTPKSATATTTPPGKAVTLSYEGSATPPTGAGNYLVSATVVDANYQGSASDTLVLAKASASVLLDSASLSQTYDGTPKSVGATTVPAGKTLNYSYNGSAVPPTGAGNYPMSATVNDANYQGSASGTLVIAQASAAVLLDPASLSQTYDGTPKSASATTVPAGKALTYRYNGNLAAPTGAGSYTVLASVSDANYQGSASGTLVVAQASAAVLLDPASLNQTYDGTPKSATATTVPAGRTVICSYNGSPAAPTEAGTYTVLATVSDPNYSGSANGTLTVQKAATPVAWATPDAIIFGTALSARQLDASTSVPGTFAYSPGLGSIPAAGSQILSAVFTPTNTTSYTIASATVTLTVIPTYQVSYLSGGNGTLSGATSQTVASGASASEVSALAAANYHFVRWSGADGFSSTDNPLKLGNVTASQTLTAIFSLNSFLVSASATSGGSISCTPSANYGADALCTISADVGFHLLALSDNEADKLSAVTGTSYVITGVTGNHLISATFARPDGLLTQAAGKTKPDISDALAVFNMVTGVTIASAADLAHADVAPLGPDGLPRGDGKLDIYDVMGILEMLLGLVQP